MIDVHMLTLPSDRPDWKEKALAAVPSWVNLHVVQAAVGPIGPQRLAAFRLGTAPYVSCIDPDDWTEPDTFDKCLEALQRHGYEGVCTREMIHDLVQRRTYECSFKHKTFVLKREWMEQREALWRFDIEDRYIIASRDIKRLPFIGHHWRRYNSTGKWQRAIKQT